jgi:phage/plasmid-like protein (TIGR03299 family)
MAHELLIQDRTAAMMYVGAEPWHGLGQKLEAPPTAEEAIRAAGLDWKVGKKPLHAREGATWYRVPERYVIVREDKWGKEDCPLFATVGETYTPLQNSEAFAFFDPLVSIEIATYETAGALGAGERIWVLARLKENLCINNKDEVQRYLLLSNGHNAATAVRILFTVARQILVKAPGRRKSSLSRGCERPTTP